MLDLCGAGSIAFVFRQEWELLLIAGVGIIFVLMGILGPSNIATGMVQVMASHGVNQMRSEQSETKSSACHIQKTTKLFI